MHLYVNSNQSHSQSSTGSFVSASFVSQLESVHDSLVFGKWLHLKGVCKHSLSSLTLPEIDSCQNEASACIANCVMPVSRPLDCVLFAE